MANFKFDINKSVQENINSFFTLLKLFDSEMAGILISNIDKLTPLPEQQKQKKTARVSFNKAVMEELEKLKKLKGPEE